MSASKIILVTGINSGIGYAITKRLSSKPYHHVIMACRDTQKAAKAKLEIERSGISGSVSSLELDVSSESSVQSAVDKVEQQFGVVDVFVSNAGTVALERDGREKMDKIFATNVTGAFSTSEAFLHLMLNSKNPYLIHISSSLGSLSLASDPESPMYASPWDEYRMSKAALNMATIQQHKRLSHQNIRVYAYCPGLVRTQLRGDSEHAVSAGGRAGDPMDSAKGIEDIVEGKRDKEAGLSIHSEGTYPW